MAILQCKLNSQTYTVSSKLGLWLGKSGAWMLGWESVQFSRSVMSNSLRSHWLQHAGLPCPSPNSQSLLKLMPIKSVMPSISSHPLSSRSAPAFNLSQHQGLFQWVVLHIRWQKYWSFSFSISLFSEYSGLIPFRIDWLGLLAVQGDFYEAGTVCCSFICQ